MQLSYASTKKCIEKLHLLKFVFFVRFIALYNNCPANRKKVTNKLPNRSAPRYTMVNIVMVVIARIRFVLQWSDYTKMRHAYFGMSHLLNDIFRSLLFNVFFCER